MSCVASQTAKLLMVGTLLSSCTYLQERTLREINGVVVNPDNDRPLAGVRIVLAEHRYAPIPFPFATDEDRPIAHATSDREGRFSFKACMTVPYWLWWEWGGFYPKSQGFRESEWSDKQAPHVTMKLYARPSLEHERKLMEGWLKAEDASLTDSCR